MIACTEESFPSENPHGLPTEKGVQKHCKKGAAKRPLNALSQ